MLLHFHLVFHVCLELARPGAYLLQGSLPMDSQLVGAAGGAGAEAIGAEAAPPPIVYAKNKYTVKSVNLAESAPPLLVVASRADTILVTDSSTTRLRIEASNLECRF